MDAQNSDRLFRIFFPYAASKLDAARNASLRFAYYTSAETAEKILRKKEFWMRKAAVMNDFMEVRYGLACLRQAYHGEAGDQLRQLLGNSFPRLFLKLENNFNGWSPYFLNDTYLTSLSEHDAREDQHGRLSMWRAYGGSTGVALVLNGTAVLSESDALKIYSSPVAYPSEQEFLDEFKRIVDLIRSEIDFVVAQGEAEIYSRLFNMFRFMVLCTKHPGFSEEREWRVIHTPALDQSKRLVASTEVIRGVPQRVFKVKLQNVPDENFTGAELNELIDKIIIGPSHFPAVTAEALHHLLIEADVLDAGKRISISGIPLRAG